MAELVLVRHGQPDWEPGGRAVDAPVLTDYGHRQARAVGEALRAEAFDAFYVSPLPRAVETATWMAAALGRDPEVLPWLAELRLAPLQGATGDEVQAHFKAMRSRDLADWWDPMPGGESFRHMYERVSAGIETLMSGSHGMQIRQNSGYRLWHPADPHARVLIVAHEGTNSVILSHLLGIEPVPWAWTRFSAPWTSITRIGTTAAAGGYIWQLRSFGVTDHLADVPR